MAALDAEDQRLLHLRIELEFDYGEIAADDRSAEPRRDQNGVSESGGASRGSDGVMTHDEDIER
jgi:hypothetical protein